MERENKIEITDELIARFITGDAEPEEALAVADWLRVDENRKEFDRLQRGWLGAVQTQQPVFNKTAAWNNLSESITTNTQPAANTRALNTTPSTLFLKIAAAVLLLAVAVTWLYVSRNGSDTRRINIATSVESKEHVFTDQSKVTLYRNSALEYPESFAENVREISLTRGEAFFRVSKDEQKPFIVHTASADIRVVGTEFDVITRDGLTEVSVKEGKVLVYTETDSIMLTAGRSAIVRRTNPEISAENVTDINVWGYATRKLVYNDTPVRDVIAGIERAYPYAVNLSDKKIGNCRFTGTFENEPAEKIVNLVADILNLTVKKNGETFTLQGQGCP